MTLGWLWWGCTPPLVGVSSQDQWMVKTPSRLMHWIPPFWGSMTSYFCPKTKQSINRSFSKSKFVEIFLSLKSVFLLCASVCVCMDLSQWKSWFSNFRNYVPRIDWGLLTEWRIYRVALKNDTFFFAKIWVFIYRGSPIRAAKMHITRCKNIYAYNMMHWPCTGLIRSVLGIRVCK